MANLIADPSLFRDYVTGQTPPQPWNGESYVASADSPTSAYAFGLLWNSNPLPEDSTISGVATFDFLPGSDEYPAGFIAIADAYSGSGGGFVASVPLQKGVPTPFSFSAEQVALLNRISPMDFRVLFSTEDGADTPQILYGLTFTLTPSVPPPAVSYNCECDDDYPRTTLAEMRKRLLRRLGFSAQANNPPPGMADLLDDFIRSAQEFLFREYSTFQRERFYTWDLIPGLRFYDLDANADACTKRLDPRMISWAGISQGDGSWRPLYCGIDPVMYTARGPGVPSHYEIRQCIELWPAPVDATWKLRIKGQFGLMPLEAGTDETTVDPEAIFLLAMANAKAHYGQPDAGNYTSQLTNYMRNLIRGAHHTRRYIPGTADPRNAVRPVPVGGWPEDVR